MARDFVEGTDTSAHASLLDATGAGWPETGWIRAAGRVLPVVAVLAVGMQFFGLYRAGGPPQAGLFPGVDKVQHLLGFALPVMLVLLTRWWFRPGRDGGVTRRFGVGVSLVFVAQAVVSEVVQATWLPMRSGDIVDGVADALGILLGWVGFSVATRVRRRHG